MATWIRLGADTEFASEMRLFQIGRKKVAVARLDGKLYAFDGYCPHVAGPMHRAEVEGTVVTCPFHAWRFDVAAQGRELHGYRPLPVYEIKIERGDVHVLVDADAAPVPLDSRPCKQSIVPA